MPNRHEINRVAIKIPPFWKANPALWFCQLEAQFKTSGITQDETKYNSVVAAIESEILAQVSDLILDPPDNDKYDTLKKRLQDCFTDSETCRIQKLLNTVQLADSRPTQLLRRMRELAGNKGSEEFIRSLWLQRLPTNVQQILSISTDELVKLATMVDKIMEVPNNNHIQSVQAQASTSSEGMVQNLAAQIEALSKQIEHMSRSTNKSSNKSRNNSRSKSRSARDGKCWYHNRYQEKAKKCVQPCNFQNAKNAKANH